MPEPVSFQEVLNRYLNNQASEQEIRMIEAWFELATEEGEETIVYGDPEMAEVYERLVMSARFQERLHQLKVQQEAGVSSQEAIRRIRPARMREGRPGLWSRVRELSPGQFWRAAAVFAGVMVTGAVIYELSRRTVRKEQPVAFIQVQTGKGEVRRIVLPDRSEVWMNANTRLAYDPDFNYHKEVRLDGEAMFNVTHDPEHPLTVWTRDSVETKVLGTRFNIASRALMHGTRVTVLDGRVAVIRNQLQLGVLERNEGIEYRSDSNSHHSTRIKNESSVDGWIRGEWEFDSLDIDDLRLLLVNQYGVNIECHRPELMNNKASANFSRKQKAEDIVKIFCLLTDCAYRWKDKSTIELY